MHFPSSSLTAEIHFSLGVGRETLFSPVTGGENLLPTAARLRIAVVSGSGVPLQWPVSQNEPAHGLDPDKREKEIVRKCKD